MLDIDKWNNNEWIESEVVQSYFNMSFSECMKKFGFCRTAKWNDAPLEGQKITCYFRKYK